jgi:hypothetical protein
MCAECFFVITSFIRLSPVRGTLIYSLSTIDVRGVAFGGLIKLCAVVSFFTYYVAMWF